MQNAQKKQPIQNQILDMYERFPDNIAITYHKKNTSYRELHEKILQIEKLISSSRIADKKPIGVCMDVSPVSISTILGVLKSEMIALPLCTVDPKDRHLEKLTSVDSPIVFCDSKYENLFDRYDGKLIIISEDWDINIRNATVNYDYSRKIKNCPEDISYILFTSGSTGKSKGVMNSIDNITEHLEIFNQMCAMTSKDVLMGFSPFYFDASLEEIFAPLSVGARYVVLDEIERMDEQLVRESLLSEKVSILSAPSPILGIVNTGLHNDKFPSDFLRLILTGGEVLKRADVDLLADHFEIKNGYGLTETTISSLWHTVSNIDEGIIPIGKPIKGKKVYILDRNLDPVHEGKSGEIYLGGQGMACGYFNDESLTKEKFIKNPFEKENNEIMFKTGDVGHFNNHGEVVFEGRWDRQVNVGGMNFSLDEVENEISRLSEIHECVAIGSTYPELERLDAYIVLKDDNTNLIDLINNIKKRLPAHMIPKKFYAVSAIPKTITGKIDYINLEKQESKNLLLNDIQNKNQITETENLVRQIWGKCFKQNPEDLPIDISMFDVGGNSLIAMQIVSKIRDLLDENFSIQNLLDKPSIKQQAEKIDSSCRKD